MADLRQQVGQLTTLLASLPAGAHPLDSLKKPGAWRDRPLPGSSAPAPIHVRAPVELEFVNITPTWLATQLTRTTSDPTGNLQLTIDPHPGTEAPIADDTEAAASAARDRAAAGLEAVRQNLIAGQARMHESTRALHEHIAAQYQAALDRARHTYAVFRVGTPPHSVILRDVAQLNRELPVHVGADFGEALRVARTQAPSATTAVSSSPTNEITESLRRFLRQIDDIIAGNSRVQGSGTNSDPFVVTKGPLCLSTPATIVFAGLPRERAKLSLKGRILLVEPTPS